MPDVELKFSIILPVCGTGSRGIGLRLWFWSIRANQTRTRLQDWSHPMMVVDMVISQRD